MQSQNLILISAKAFLLIAFAPLLSGIIRKIKNSLRMRKGAVVLQPYFNLRKLFFKSEVVSGHASWIFYAAPAVLFAGSVCASFLVLMLRPQFCLESAGILISVFFVLGLGRFFLALAGLDTGSSFGGMGSSREMFISTFTEPSAFISAFVLYMNTGLGFKASVLLAGIAMLLVVIAETSRIPVDNQETHLELTMVHEAMTIEYSGRSLALIELAGHIKQMIFFAILSLYFSPSLALQNTFLAGFIPVGWEWIEFAVKILAFGAVIAVIEVSVAKMRLFRVVDFLSFSFFIALLGCVAASLGL